MTAHSTNRPFRMVFTSRAGGASALPYNSFNLAEHVGDDPEAVAANRARLNRVLDAPYDVVWMEQLHTNTVRIVTQIPTDGAPIAACDALVTAVPGLPLGVLVADCTPVLAADPVAGVVAAIHAGRLGARNEIVPRTIAAMESLGAHARNIRVLLGPAASGRNYEVPEQMAADMEAHLPGSRTRTRQGTAGVDIRAGLWRQLEQLGVVHIDSDPRCTIEDTAFFSYRREKTTGRQAGVVWLSGGDSSAPQPSATA